MHPGYSLPVRWFCLRPFCLKQKERRWSNWKCHRNNGYVWCFYCCCIIWHHLASVHFMMSMRYLYNPRADNLIDICHLIFGFVILGSTWTRSCNESNWKRCAWWHACSTANAAIKARYYLYRSTRWNKKRMR